MKAPLLAFGFILLAFIGCKKENINPLDQYVGSYDIKGKITYPTISNENTDIMLVTKSGKSNGLVLALSTITLSATMGENGNFKLDTYKVDQTIDGFPVHTEIDGSGTIVGSDLVMTLEGITKEVGKTTKQTIAINGKKRE
ncbi:hypothetical protein [Spirosoma litoris]